MNSMSTVCYNTEQKKIRQNNDTMPELSLYFEEIVVRDNQKEMFYGSYNWQFYVNRYIWFHYISFEWLNIKQFATETLFFV